MWPIFSPGVWDTLSLRFTAKFTTTLEPILSLFANYSDDQHFNRARRHFLLSTTRGTTKMSPNSSFFARNTRIEPDAERGLIVRLYYQRQIEKRNQFFSTHRDLGDRGDECGVPLPQSDREIVGAAPAGWIRLFFANRTERNRKHDWMSMKVAILVLCALASPSQRTA